MRKLDGIILTWDWELAAKGADSWPGAPAQDLSGLPDK
ncbi:BZ3500_MvSof-1268-A1-R1_Chr1-3g01939 [Microbotryum saponariae]|uniref:BZ3500_MvSof-1268-A1-R1_Chr1-3g01939 protein n=1 Tax=Microbotryum saponariae TaxID=289078 RepID=A0A2X0KBY8_9BASI|nr:BZ3500_MvSof-1268-A1-R1_Chr1-3g01939 [Microbotryum saponariae]SCZ94957.1 BZ3501_MvSof-1269-A2-R1_Chr1-3g01541 [Microbotryum saponariae]